MYTGRNDQNFERLELVRSTFIPEEEEHDLVSGDLAQAEARVVAWLAQEPTLMALFAQGKDPYRWLAGTFRQIADWEAISKKDPWRQLFKAVAHASHYGMGPPTLAEMLDTDMGIYVSNKEARSFLEWYFATCPNIKSVFQREVEVEVRQFRCLTNILGRKRWFYGQLDAKTMREAYSYKPQGISDIVKKALQEMDAKGYKIIQEGHDSLLIDSPKSKTEQCKKDLDKAMTMELYIKGEILVIPRDIEVLESWGGMTHEARRQYIETIRSGSKTQVGVEAAGARLLTEASI
jgi:DNA polymerase I-like protein with 3'-5' exonuclease and polymerase domains